MSAFAEVVDAEADANDAVLSWKGRSRRAPDRGEAPKRGGGGDSGGGNATSIRAARRLAGALGKPAYRILRQGFGKLV